MAAMALPDPPVDTRDERSVSFAPPDQRAHLDPSEPRSLIPLDRSYPTLVATPSSGAHRDDVSGFPIQYAKVQPPPLREETLARHRLLDWLAAKIHHRVILVLADAGYGKTTLLTDFSGRTRLRTIWYRLDDDDRDWISLLHHLVAAGREVDPAFAPTTAAMLADTSLTGPTRDAVIDTFMRELQGIAPHGAVLIFDDFHLVDGAPDVQRIARELVSRAPERLTVVFASRRLPGIPLSRLRSIGEVAELTTDDLRFDADETARLFRDTYGRTLDPDVIADVAARTEGWAASLQLVNAALRDRTPGEVRSFVRSLSGADHELYDYLAEEVVGDLSEDLQEFLMRTSILQVVTPELAGVATGLEPPIVANLTAAAERVTLLSRRARGPRTELRYHPLVRGFLEDRLAREHGDDAVRALHRTVAAYAESIDWRIAAHHHWLADDRSQAHDIIDRSAQSIIGRGEYLVAAPYVADLPEKDQRASFAVVLSRSDFRRGDVESALDHAKQAIQIDPRSEVGQANLASLSLTMGDAVGAERAARILASLTSDPIWLGIAEGFIEVIEASIDGDIRRSVDRLTSIAAAQGARDQSHFEGISYLNLSESYRALGHADAASAAAAKALDLLESSSAGAEMASARAISAWSQAHLGHDNAWATIGEALQERNRVIRADVLLEAAELELFYGDEGMAADYLDAFASSGSEYPAPSIPAVALAAIRAGRPNDAIDILESTDLEVPTGRAGHKAQALAIYAHALVAARDDRSSEAIGLARRHALAQGAYRWTAYLDAIAAVDEGPDALGRLVRLAQPETMWSSSYIAEFAATSLGALAPRERQSIAAEAVRRPRRWRGPLRQAIDHGGTESVEAARILESIGEHEDVARLRRLARRYRGRPEAELGRALARRIAPKVRIEDLGRVSMSVGERPIEGSDVRRKVLALLCFLVSRPRMSAARDEVMDALWPEIDPADALNSLNQTVYFLRRIFEPDYKDDLSPGYLHHDSDVMWLDPGLVWARSQACLELMRGAAQGPQPKDVEELSRDYVAPFALDFTYEEWATDYRASLHAAYLQIVETAVAADTASGHFDRGLNLARRALEISPDADQIELSLLRLLRLSGSHAAAAEQYSHYAAAQRETYGIEPPALDTL